MRLAAKEELRKALDEEEEAKEAKGTKTSGRSPAVFWGILVSWKKLWKGYSRAVLFVPQIERRDISDLVVCMFV